MNFKIFFLSVIMFLTLALIAEGQTEEAEVEQIVESMAENSEEGFDYSEASDRLSFLRKHPINLNKATREQLQEIIILAPLQVHALISYREENGLYIDEWELQAVPGMDLPTIQKLLPYVTLTVPVTMPTFSFHDLKKSGEHDLILRYGQVLQRQAGYQKPDSSKSGYVGGPERILTRYRYNYKDEVAVGLALEKDAGERMFSWGNKKGFDFQSGFLSIQSKSALKRLVVGDFSLQFGQGLTLWSGLGFGKGPSIGSLVKKEVGLRPYSSTNESLFFRGAAATVQSRKFTFTPFISYNKLDGTLNEGNEVKSINYGGYHRTENELKWSDKVSYFIYGSAVEYSHRNFKIGAVGYHTSFDRSFEQKEPGYQLFDFSSSALTNLGVFYHYSYRNAFLFGEASHSLRGGVAYLTGLMTSLTKAVSVVLINRNYQKNYSSFFNTALAESSEASNEKAFYSGIVISPSSKIELSAYADVFKFPWLTFRADAPSKGCEVLSEFSYTPSKRLKASVRIKSENKEENSVGANISELIGVVKNNYRLELSYKIRSSIQVRNRIEVASYHKGNGRTEYGNILIQDISYTPLSSRFTGNIRFAIFDTESFNTRIYAYENDVLYGYSAPGYQDRGIRFYINSRWKVKKGFDVWLKYAASTYTNIDQVGSGTERIEGNKKSEIKLQVRLQL